MDVVTDEAAEQDVDDYLLLQPETIERRSAVHRAVKKRPSRKELFDVLTSAFTLLAVSLSRDKRFAALITPPMPHPFGSELFDDSTAILLDEQ